MARKRKWPLLLAILYLVFYFVILYKNVVYSVGDQTDSIRAGVAAFPLGLVLAFVYPGGRDETFFVISLAAIINAAIIYFVPHWYYKQTDPSE